MLKRGFDHERNYILEQTFIRKTDASLTFLGFSDTGTKIIFMI